MDALTDVWRLPDGPLDRPGSRGTLFTLAGADASRHYRYRSARRYAGSWPPGWMGERTMPR